MAHTTSSKTRVLISGLSIAGPALAYWLDRYGFDVTIVERAPALRPGGYGVDIRGAAVEVISRMGILDKVRAADTNMQGVYFVDQQGKVEGKMSDAAMANEKGVDIEIFRQDFSAILFDLIKDRVKFIWNDSITALRETEGQVKVTFERAAVQKFDLVIGADGMHSAVRRLAFGDEREFNRFLGCYISIFTLDNYLNLQYKQLLHSTPGRTVGMLSARQNSEAKGMFLFKSEPLQYDHHNTDQQKKLVAEAFAGQKGWETQMLLKHMKKAPDFYFDSISQIHMPGWTKGRVALVGDAAYGPSPLSGQGSSMALVGAYVLAGELKAAGGDYVAAFRAYEQGLRTFIEKNQKIGRITAESMVENTKFSIWLRNATLRIPGFMSLMFKIIGKMVAKTANAIELKDY